MKGSLRDRLEHNQVIIYIIAVLLATLSASIFPGTATFEAAINPALALMLFVTFLQVPVSELGKALTRVNFLIPLLIANFVVVPLLVAVLIQFLPQQEPLLLLGVLFVLLTPCIDYVVTFSQLGRSDSRLLLASTPALLIMQVVLLPVYLQIFLGAQASELVRIGPFIHAFLWLIVAPLGLAALMQFLAAKTTAGNVICQGLGMLPVPSTALVLFVVVAAMVPQLDEAKSAAMSVAPLYIAFAIIAPLAGWAIARLFRLNVTAARAIAFSTGTRNSLVVLPLALAVPGAIPVLPAVIVTQTLVELFSELIYIRLIPRLGGRDKNSAQSH